MLLNTQWFQWAPSKNILAYIEGSGRVALENKHLKLKELPALQQSPFTPKGYVDWDFTWKNDQVIVVSRAKEAGIETPPEKGHCHLYMRSIVRAINNIKSQSHLKSKVIIILSS